MAAPNFPTSIPQNVRTALEGILTDIPGSTVRQDIVTALQWPIENMLPIGRFLNSLGLCVENGLLCYTTKDVIPTYSAVPEGVSHLLQAILTAQYGRDVRYAIAEVLEFGADYATVINTFAEDLGLVVRDGKLCAVYQGPDVRSEDEAVCESIYVTPGAQVRDNGMIYVGVPDAVNPE